MNTFNERNYFTTLKFILIKAVYDFDHTAIVKIKNSLNKGIYGEIIREGGVTPEDISIIKSKMRETINEDLPINRVTMPVCDLQKKDCFSHRPDIFRLVDNSDWIDLQIYEIQGFYDYFHNGMYPSTGHIPLFDLEPYNGGFILRFPFKSNPHRIPVGENHKKLAKIFHESTEWGRILEVEDVGMLNEKVRNEEIYELIRVNEALHHKKLAIIASEISKQKHIKLITIAGPSSSGKTTFTNRLGIHLRVNGVKPLIISLDNYYRGRKYVPFDKNGEKDFEALEALDLDLLNIQLKELIDGKQVEVPRYNFHLGERENIGKKVQLPENGILLIEGIHGLNDKLTEHLDKDIKFKIYISCLTTLNIDDHNRIPSSEVRKLRRIVRDSISRGTSADGTLAMWKSVRRGEEKNIFPFQEEADAIFDSSLVYELGILKKYALKELEKIEVTNIHFEEAHRLIKFISYFKDIEDKWVPDDSILKEFVGGSYFYKY